MKIKNRLEGLKELGKYDKDISHIVDSNEKQLNWLIEENKKQMEKKICNDIHERFIKANQDFRKYSTIPQPKQSLHKYKIIKENIEKADIICNMEKFDFTTFPRNYFHKNN